MAELIGIAGPSGSGKSTSLRNLNPKETYVINVSRKPLPFKGSKKAYSAENKNYFESDDYAKIITVMKGISDTRPEVKYVVLDDANYIMAFEHMKRSKEAGYGKFTDMAKHMSDIFETARLMRGDMKFIYMTHTEDVVDSGSIKTQKFKTVGAMLDNTIVLEGLFTYVFYTFVDRDAKDVSKKYSFITNYFDCYPAKTPMGVFDDIKIDNDLNEVIKKIDAYMNEE